MLLTKDQILRLLAECEYKTVFEETGPNGVRVQRRKSGYSDDGELIKIQGALSIMLQVTAEAEAGT